MIECGYDEEGWPWIEHGRFEIWYDIIHDRKLNVAEWYEIGVCDSKLAPRNWGIV